MTTITGGVLNLSNSAALQASTVIAPTASGASIVFDPSVSSHAFTFGGLGDGGSLTLQDNAGTPITLTVGDNNGSTTYSGALGGSGSLVKAGTGTLTLIGTSSYINGTTVSAGTLQLGDGTTGHNGVLSSTGGIIDNATLAYNLAGSQSYSGIISGIGNLTKSGTGTLVLQAANSFSGMTTVAGGTLDLANSGALLQSTLTAPTTGSLQFDSTVSSRAFTLGGLSDGGSITLLKAAARPSR